MKIGKYKITRPGWTIIQSILIAIRIATVLIIRYGI